MTTPSAHPFDLDPLPDDDDPPEERVHRRTVETDDTPDIWFRMGVAAHGVTPYTDSPFSPASDATHWWTRGWSYQSRLMRAIEAETTVRNQVQDLAAAEAELATLHAELVLARNVLNKTIDDLEKAQEERDIAQAEAKRLGAELLSLTKYKAVSMNESDGPYALQYPGNDPVCMYDPDHDPWEAYELFTEWLRERARAALVPPTETGQEGK